MAYKDLGKGDQGGPYGGAMPKGNSKRPQNYTGQYVSEIRYRADGQQAVDPAPTQGFRKELPAPSKPNYATSEYEPSVPKGLGWK